MNKLWLLVLMSWFLQSCKTESIQPGDFFNGKEYYPVSVGKVLEYEVFEVQYKPNSVDTFRYTLKEEISQLISDNGVEKQYNLSRYKADLGMDYIQDSLWAVKVSNTEVIKHSHNQPLKVLSFPIQTDDKWDINTYISKANDNVMYTNINQIFEGYTNTITTSHDNSSDDINKNVRYSVYAPEVGLVFKLHHVTSQQPGESKTGSYITHTLIR